MAQHERSQAMYTRREHAHLQGCSRSQLYHAIHGSILSRVCSKRSASISPGMHKENWLPRLRCTKPARQLGASCLQVNASCSTSFDAHHPQRVELHTMRFGSTGRRHSIVLQTLKVQQGLPVGWGQWTAQPDGFQHRSPFDDQGRLALPPELLSGRSRPPGFYEAIGCRGNCPQSEGWCGRSARRAVAAPCLQQHEIDYY